MTLLVRVPEKAVGPAPPEKFTAPLLATTVPPVGSVSPGAGIVCPAVSGAACAVKQVTNAKIAIAATAFNRRDMCKFSLKFRAAKQHRKAHTVQRTLLHVRLRFTTASGNGFDSPR